MIIFRLLSVELLVLIAALFLLVYIAKSQVSKWFTYGTVLIIITIIVMMVCTVCCAMCMRHCGPGPMPGECGMEQQCGPGGMMMHHGGMMKRIMIRDGKCEEEMEEGEMRGEGGEMKCHEGAGMKCCKEGEDKDCCKKGMHDGKCMDKDSMQKKEVIIKKK